ncbi:MAG TPA: lipoyl(octanoyl) transferase LipB [bacterium]
MRDELYVLDLGFKNYQETWDLQKELHRLRLNNTIPDTLILVEHDPVVTMGKSGKEKNLLMPRPLLKEKGIEYYEIERGGDITFHGPGQLVGYLIFDIKKGLTGIKPFMHKIEDAIIETLRAFDIESCRKEKLIGIWTSKGKICSIGVAVQRWVSFHGFALNVNTDLKYFDLIVPCGIAGITMTSMAQNLGNTVAINDVKEKIIDSFADIFEKETWRKCLAEITSKSQPG